MAAVEIVWFPVLLLTNTVEQQEECLTCKRTRFSSPKVLQFPGDLAILHELAN